MDNDIKYLGYIEKGTGKHQSNCVYDTGGASPTVCSVIGDKYNIIILVETIEKETEQNTKVIVYDDYNSRVRCDADVGTIGAITTNIGASALRNGYKLIIAYG